MPKVSLRVGQAEVYVTLAQLEDATKRLVAAQPTDDKRPALSSAAGAIANFVEESHGHLSGVAKLDVLPDLRHAALWLRNGVLKLPLGKEERNMKLGIVKSLLRKHVAYAELRHFDGTGLSQLAVATAALAQEVLDSGHVDPSAVSTTASDHSMLSESSIEQASDWLSNVDLEAEVLQGDSQFVCPASLDDSIADVRLPCLPSEPLMFADLEALGGSCEQSDFPGEGWADVCLPAPPGETREDPRLRRPPFVPVVGWPAVVHCEDVPFLQKFVAELDHSRQHPDGIGTLSHVDHNLTEHHILDGGMDIAPPGDDPMYDCAWDHVDDLMPEFVEFACSYEAVFVQQPWTCELPFEFRFVTADLVALGGGQVDVCLPAPSDGTLSHAVHDDDDDDDDDDAVHSLAEHHFLDGGMGIASPGVDPMLDCAWDHVGDLVPDFVEFACSYEAVFVPQPWFCELPFQFRLVTADYGALGGGQADVCLPAPPDDAPSETALIVDLRARISAAIDRGVLIDDLAKELVDDVDAHGYSHTLRSHVDDSPLLCTHNKIWRLMISLDKWRLTHGCGLLACKEDVDAIGANLCELDSACAKFLSLARDLLPEAPRSKKGRGRRKRR